MPIKLSWIGWWIRSVTYAYLVSSLGSEIRAKTIAIRAAIRIGVNQTEGMTTLQAAAQGTRDVAAWATAQGCDVTLLVDDNRRSTPCKFLRLSGPS
jgi:hypothetical protein